MLVLEVVSKRPVSVTLHLLFATLERRKELEPKCVPQLILGSLLRTCGSAIGQFFPSPWKQPQKSLRKWTRPISLLVSEVANQYYINGNSSLQHQAVSFISTDMDKGRVEVPWFLERGVSSIRLYNLISIQDKLNITFFVFFSIVDWCHECPRILDYICRVSFPFFVS